MMKFTDTLLSETGARTRSAESLSFGGVWIEDDLPGFRVLHTSGRELLARELTTQDISGIDGSSYVSSRLPVRTITVTYQIISKNPKDYRAIFNRLNYLLSGNDKQIIFADEPDKYFTGTVTSMSNPEAGRRCSVGSFEITCLDPYKYSLVEKPFPLRATQNPAYKTIELVNEGTVSVPVRYEFTLTNDDGYVGINPISGALLTAGIPASMLAMQFGARMENDTVFDTRDEQSLPWQAIKAPGSGNSVGHPISVTNQRQDKGERLTLDWLSITPGTECGAGSWCYGYKTIDIPKTSINTDVFDFEIKAQTWFECARADEIGEQWIEFYGEKDGADYQMARLAFSKGSPSLSAEIVAHVDGKLIRADRFTPNSTSSYASGTSGFIAIRKIGDTVTFFSKGPQEAWSASVAGGAAMPLKKIRIGFGHRPGTPYLTRNYFRDIRILAKNVAGQWSVKNTFFADGGHLDLTIDGNDSRFFVDGIESPQLEVIGTQYFKLPPGTSTLAVVFSSWFKGGASGRALIREAWL